jgi:hypothetical protein
MKRQAYHKSRPVCIERSMKGDSSMKSGLAALCRAVICAAAGFSAAPALAQTPTQAVEPVRAQSTTSASQSKMKVCADEWNAKKAANETGNQKYRDFVKECLSRTATAPEQPAPAAPAPGTATAPPPASQPPAARPPAAQQRTATPAPTQTAPAAPAAPGQPVFPSAVSPKYASESAGRARMHTCLDQYHENKATGGNAGLNWIQKGGGYYSECTKRLKG